MTAPPHTPRSSDPCQRCGQVHTQCTAHNRHGEPCRRPPNHGLTVCATHGGRAPQSIAAAKARLEHAAAAAAVATFGLPVDIDPHTALTDELCRTAGHVAWLAQQVAQLDGTADLEEQLHPGANQPAVLIRLYQAERSHLARVAAECVKAGVEERRVRVIEDMAAQLQAFTAALVAGLGLDITDQRVRHAIETAARELDPGPSAA